MNKNKSNMYICRTLVIAGIVLSQLSNANAQFGGGIGDMINKKLNKLTPSQDRPPTTEAATPNNTSVVNSTDAPGQKAIQKKTPVSDVNASSPNLPPIFESARQWDAAQFAELLKKDMSSINRTVDEVSGKRFRSGYEKRDSNGTIIPDEAKKFADYTLLAFAAENGCTNIIQQLLDVEVDIKSQNGPDPLGLAAGNGHIEAVKMLMKAGAGPGFGVLAACKKNRPEMLKTLIDAGAKALGCLQMAAKDGNAEIVQIILNSDRDQKDKQKSEFERQAAFQNAVAKGHLDVVKIFVAEGQDVSAGEEYGEKTPIQIARDANHAEVFAYLKEVKQTQDAKKAEKEATLAKERDTREADARAKEKAAKEKEEAALSEVVDAVRKKINDAFNHPKDVYGLANGRYRKFNGKVYDCVEPLEFLNRLAAFKFVNASFSCLPESEQKNILARQEVEAKWLNENLWNKVEDDCTLLPVLVKQVTTDGLIVRLNSRVDEEVLVFLKNHPKQKTYVDGDAMLEPIFVMKSDPYHYTSVLGAVRTIRSYDCGAAVKPPSGSVAKVPLPDTSH